MILCIYFSQQTFANFLCSLTLFHKLLTFYYVVDIDECVQSDDHPCHSSAVCENTIGSYTCACSDGYAQSGSECICKLFQSYLVHAFNRFACF